MRTHFNLSFGIISIFGIEEQIDLEIELEVSFGIISIFGIEELHIYGLHGR